MKKSLLLASLIAAVALAVATLSGCAFLAPLPPEAEGFAPTFAVGPRREMLLGHAQFIAPHGDMMISGCHGLLHGLALREA